ncbi:hypothetical protein BC332_07721 [Capsicum chinense]|nr:hypothetical protein BC332_07721 [Capsicum chinense]
MVKGTASTSKEKKSYQSYADAPLRRCERLALDGFRRSRGRPKKYWREVIRHDMEQLQFTEDMTLDRKMLDDFVDVTKDEKQLMHLWNSFVRKQRGRADEEIDGGLLKNVVEVQLSAISFSRNTWSDTKARVDPAEPFANGAKQPHTIKKTKSISRLKNKPLASDAPVNSPTKKTTAPNSPYKAVNR